MTDVTTDRGSSFRIGNVLNRAWEIFGPNFVVFICITFILALPNFLYLMRDPRLPGYFTVFFSALFVGLVINTIGQAVILFASFQQLRGQPVEIAGAFQRGLARFFPIVGIGILTSLGFFLGAMLLLVPAFILMTMWAVAVPACVVEGLGPVSSISRSSALTKGHRWQIFGIVILLAIANAVVGGLVGFVLGSAGLVVKALGSVIWTAVWTAYWNCALIMIYHDLRVAKEGIDTEQIAAVFD